MSTGFCQGYNHAYMGQYKHSFLFHNRTVDNSYPEKKPLLHEAAVNKQMLVSGMRLIFNVVEREVMTGTD